jgi:glycosyltransferase involved in cell wall biosynthesis
MRILHLIHTPRHSGAEILVRDLCVIYRDWGHESAIASFSPSQPEFHADANALEDIGVTLFFPSRAKVKFGRIFQFRTAVVEFKPDVIFAHSVLPSIYGRFALPRLFGCNSRFVSVLHAANNYGFGFSGAALSISERLTRPLVDHVIAVSDEGAKNYRSCFGQYMPISVIKNGIDINRFTRVNRLESRAKFGLSEEQRIVLQVGRIYDIKQQQFSLKILQSLLAPTKVQLWFAGFTEDAEYERILLHQVEILGLSHAVRFLGSRDDIPELLSAADLFLMPSKQEAHSIALLEALASTVPIIASNIPAFSFAQEMPSVRICGMSDLQAWTEAAETMIYAPRAVRDMSNYSIAHTAKNYLEVAK